MNLFEELNEKEKMLVSNLEKIENRIYTKEDLRRIESKIVEDIMSNSKNNIQTVKAQYDGILDKLECAIRR